MSPCICASHTHCVLCRAGGRHQPFYHVLVDVRHRPYQVRPILFVGLRSLIRLALTLSLGRNALAVHRRPRDSHPSGGALQEAFHHAAKQVTDPLDELAADLSLQLVLLLQIRELEDGRLGAGVRV